MTIYEEIQSLIRQGKTNKEIQDKLAVTYSQINYQRKKIKRGSDYWKEITNSITI